MKKSKIKDYDNEFDRLSEELDKLENTNGQLWVPAIDTDGEQVLVELKTKNEIHFYLQAAKSIKILDKIRKYGVYKINKADEEYFEGLMNKANKE